MLLRPLLFLTFAGLLLLPDWSAARPFRRRVNSAPLPCPTSYSYPATVVYSQPVYVPQVYAPPVYLPPAVACPPVTPAPKGPTVIPERMAEPRAVEPKTSTPKVMSADAKTDPKPAPSVIRTVGNEERLPPMPIPVPPRPVAEPQPSLPKMTLDLAPPKAIIEESQKPAVKPDPLPSFPLPGKDKEPKADPLPAFDLPPLPPLAPPQPAAPDAPTTAKSSPLNADAAADVYPVSGPAPADRAAKRSVGFVNKSGRDVVLTVAGKLTTLPAGHALQMTLPAKFAWQIGGEKERHVTVPDAARGVDVVIRR